MLDPVCNDIEYRTFGGIVPADRNGRNDDADAGCGDFFDLVWWKLLGGWRERRWESGTDLQACVEFWNDTYSNGGTVGMFIYKGTGRPGPVTVVYCFIERLTSGDDWRRGEREGMVVVSWDGE